jgi:hypothetical protein
MQRARGGGGELGLLYEMGCSSVIPVIFIG